MQNNDYKQVFNGLLSCLGDVLKNYQNDLNDSADIFNKSTNENSCTAAIEKYLEDDINDLIKELNSLKTTLNDVYTDACETIDIKIVLLENILKNIKKS